MVSPPAREVWVEINVEAGYYINPETSPPAREVWVEIPFPSSSCSYSIMSPPAREVWVEIGVHLETDRGQIVASREGGVG